MAFPAPPDLFRGLNRFVEPLVRSGIGAPGPFPTGAIVLENRGRKSGEMYRVPLLVWMAGRIPVVSTLRRDSHWVRNVQVDPEVHIWINGRRRRAHAYVITPESSPSGEMPSGIGLLVTWLAELSRTLGVRYVVLDPAARNETETAPDSAESPQAAQT